MSSFERMLIIEDDQSLYKPLRHVFEGEGYAVDFASDGAAGLASVRATPPDIVVLDLKLPKMHGREVCRTIKQETPNLPVVVLSAVADEIDKVLLLELGADDYVTKPFSPRELLARVHSIMRRAQVHAQAPKVASDTYTFADVCVDFSKMEVTRGGAQVELTHQEFKILKYFVRNPERVISRDELLNEVWGYNCYPSTRTVDNHLMKLRQKLEKDTLNPSHFKTVHGAGYKFVP
jgi:DNA-binding response OmpR family regulator